MKELKESNFDGFLSLEPHLAISTLKLLTVFPFPDRSKGHVDYEEYRITEWEKDSEETRSIK